MNTEPICGARPESTGENPPPRPATPTPDPKTTGQSTAAPGDNRPGRILSDLALWFYRAGGAARFETISDAGWSVYELRKLGWIRTTDSGRWCERYAPAGALELAVGAIRHAMAGLQKDCLHPRP